MEKILLEKLARELGYPKTMIFDLVEDYGIKGHANLLYDILPLLVDLWRFDMDQKELNDTIGWEKIRREFDLE